jgi:CheY-like chemotaxis protein
MAPDTLLSAGYEKIMIMEENPRTRNIIKRSLNNLGYHVVVANNADEAIRAATRKKVSTFILDINMGENRVQEGLDALEKLKKVDSELFVGLLTSYARRHREMARKLRANVFQEKSENIPNDVMVILREMIKERRNVYEKNLEVMDDLLIREDKNLASYDRCRIDPLWYEEHKGVYVAFANGEMIYEDIDEQRFFKELRSRISNTDIFYVKVEESDEIIDIPSPFELEI